MWTKVILLIELVDASRRDGRSKVDGVLRHVTDTIPLSTVGLVQLVLRLF